MTLVVDHLSTGKTNWRSSDPSMTPNETSDDLHDPKNKYFITHAEWHQIKGNSNSGPVNILDQLKSFDLFMTENTTSDDLHDHINNFLISCDKWYIK